MNSAMYTIGIDFGTSNSKMAWYNPGTGLAETLKNAEGEEVTPSAVYFDKSEILVGKPAMEMLEDEMAWERVILSVKRSLVNAPLINLPDRVVMPVEVVAEILRKLRNDAKEQQFHQEVTHAVITCPASFDGLERDELEKAAKLAGFSAVKLLPEPVAAALAYTRIREKTGLAVGNQVLIYDLGGGTFDLAVLVREQNGLFRLGLPPQGIKRCGGDDFDEAFYNYCDKLAQAQLGRPISLMGERDLHFLYECRKRKENLTSSKRRTFSSYLSPDAKLFKYEIDQETFERLIRDKVEQTVQKTKAMLEKAQDAGYKVDSVVLVGGSSQVPLVKRLLDEHVPLKATAWQYREVAVALGAAYHADNTWNVDSTGKAQSEQYSNMAKTIWPTQKVDQFGRSVVAQYRRAVEAAWRDKSVDETEVQRLAKLAGRLGVSKEEAVAVECLVMGDTKELLLTRQPVAGIRPANKTGGFSLATTLNGHTNIVWCVAISPDGQTLASSSEDGTIRVWNLPTGALRGVISGHTAGVYTVAIHPDGQTLYSGSADTTVRAWNLRSGALLHIFTGQSKWLANVTSLDVSPGGRLLASGGRDKNIKFWNLNSGALLRPLVGHADIVWSVAFSPDGQFLASGSADRSVRLWNLRAGTLISSFTEHRSSVQSLAFSPNGTLLVSGGGDQQIKFWNLRTGAPLPPLSGHTGMIYSLAFSPDGQFLASGSFDRTVRLWDMRTGVPVTTLSGHTGGIQSLAFSPDGATLVSGSTDATIKLWKRF